jgi:N-acetylneuraminate synthase
MVQLKETFGLPVGLSDHSLNIYTCLGAVALGASALEKHFTISRSWPGPDIPLSIEPHELKMLVEGSRAVFEARGGKKTVLPEEQPVIDFAYATVVTTRPVSAGELFSHDNVWVKRPGTGEILAAELENVVGRPATRDLPADVHVRKEDVGGHD